MKSKWTKEEIEYLKENYSSKSTEDIAIKLNRTKNSIQLKAIELKIRKPKAWPEDKLKFFIENFSFTPNKELSKILNKTELSLRNKAHELGLKKDGIFWSEAELKFLIDNYKKLSVKDISKYINRSKECIMSKASLLGIKKDPVVNSDQAIIIKKLYKDGKDLDFISNETSLSKKTIVHYASSRNIRNSRLHGLSNTRIYNIWLGMKSRCLNANEKRYKDYGGRGIKICEEWLNDFINFYNWAVENGYKQHLTIDRIDVNGDYCSVNCRFTNYITQANNKRTNVALTAWGETKTLAEWSRDDRCCVTYQTIRNRIKKGYNAEKSISEV